VSRTFGLILIIAGGVLIFWAQRKDISTTVTNKEIPVSKTSGSGKSLAR
jgi:hypothetical protein